MLTEKALRERKWGPFPALRQVLEEKPSSGRHYGLTSVSDTVFQRFQRLVDIAVAADEHEEVLLQAVRARPGLGGQMAEDLWRLRDELEALRDAFSREIEAVRSLSDEVYKLAGNLSSEGAGSPAQCDWGP